MTLLQPVWQEGLQQVSSLPGSQLSPIDFLCFELNLFIYQICLIPFAYSQPTCPCNAAQIPIQFTSAEHFFSPEGSFILLAWFWALGNCTESANSSPWELTIHWESPTHSETISSWRGKCCNKGSSGRMEWGPAHCGWCKTPAPI